MTTGAETLYLTIQGHSLIGLDVSECKIAEYLLFLIKPYLDYKSVCRRVTNIFFLCTYPFGWLGNRQSDWLLFDLFRGACNRIRLIGPVDPDPHTNRSLPVPFKHQLRNWWSNFILLKGWDGGCVFRPRWALCAASSALILRENNFGSYRITVALYSSVILSCVIDIPGAYAL